MLLYDSWFSELIAAYQNYHNKQSDDTAITLANAILKSKSPFLRSPGLDIPERSVDHARFETSGSSGPIEIYRFGPYQSFWLDVIEKHLRRQNGAFTITINSPWQLNDEFLETSIEVVKNHRQHDLIFNCDLRQPLAVLPTLERLFAEHGPLNLAGHAYYWLYTFTNPVYIEWFTKSMVKSVINSDLDPLFPSQTQVPVNDQMINWQTGMNFFTCEVGKRHCLPLWWGNVNLLNIAEINDRNDDLMRFAFAISHCQCGRYYIDTEFIPHVRNQLIKDGLIFRPLDLTNKLRTNFRSLQLHQTPTDFRTLNVYFSTGKDTKTLADDLDIIREEIKPLTVVFHQDKFIRCGKKLPAFWRGTPCVGQVLRPW